MSALGKSQRIEATDIKNYVRDQIKWMELVDAVYC